MFCTNGSLEVDALVNSLFQTEILASISLDVM